ETSGLAVVRGLTISVRRLDSPLVPRGCHEVEVSRVQRVRPDEGHIIEATSSEAREISVKGDAVDAETDGPGRARHLTPVCELVPTPPSARTLSEPPTDLIVLG